MTLIHTDPLGITIPDAKLGLPPSLAPVPAGLISCAQLSRFPLLGRCPAGAQAAGIPPAGIIDWQHSQASTVWPAAAISAQRLQRLPAQGIFVGTNGSTPAIERARTVLELAYPHQYDAPATIGGLSAQGGRTSLEYEQLAQVVILVSLPIAGCTLAVSVAAGLFLSAQMGYSLRPPGPEYYVIVLAGLVASLGIIASTLPVLNRITGPETARNE